MPATAQMPSPTESTPSRSGSDDRLQESIPAPALEVGQLLFRTLGTAEIHIGGETVITPGSERMFALLCVCAMTPEQAVARARLLELVWPELDDASGRHSLRQHLYRLRQLGIEIDGTRASVRLSRQCLVPSFSLDRTAALFDRDVLRGSEPFGHLFAGWRPSQPSMRQWVERQREQYHADVRRILVPELRRLRDRGDWEECERWARTVLEFDPLNEDATVIVAEAVAMLGSRVDATTFLEEFVRETGAKGTELGRRVERTQQRIQRASRLLNGESAPSTLIGRDRELAALDALTLSAMQGESQVVELVGPAGIGKTELGYEATRRAVIVGFARCIVRVSRPVGQVAHGTLSRLTRDLLNLPGSLGCRPENLRLLRQFAGVELDSADSVSQTPIAECLMDLVAAVADEQPLVIFLDDLHYSDDQSIQELQRLFDLLQRIRVLVLTTTRDESAAPVVATNSDRRNTTLKLAGLSFEEGVALATSVRTASGRFLEAASAESVARASGSSPLAIVTLAREQLLAGLTNRNALGLRETLSRQLARLSDECRTILTVLAVLGGKAHVKEVDDITDMSLTDRTRALRVLLESGLVAECAPHEIGCHDEVQEALTRFVPQVELDQVRRHSASALLERLRGQFSSDRAIATLSLLEKSTEVESFVDAVVEYAPRLAAAGLFRGALGFLESARQASPDSPRRAAVLEKLVHVANMAAEWRTVRSSASQLRQLSAESDSMSPRIALADIEAALQSDLYPDSRIHVVRALQLAKSGVLGNSERTKALRLVISAGSDLFLSDLAMSAYSELHSDVDDSVRLAAESAEPHMQYHAVFGQLDFARRLAAQIHEDRLAIATSASGVRLLNNASLVFRVTGETDRARECMELVLSLPSIEQSDLQKAMAFWRLSLIELDSGDIRAAVSWADSLFALADGNTGQQEYAWSKLHRLRMEYLKLGRISDASLAIGQARNDRNSLSRLDVYCTALSLHARHGTAMSGTENELLLRAVSYLDEYGRFAGMDFLATSIAEVAHREGVFPMVRAALWRYFGRNRRERSVQPAHFSALADDAQELILCAISSVADPNERQPETGSPR